MTRGFYVPPSIRRFTATQGEENKKPPHPEQARKGRIEGRRKTVPCMKSLPLSPSSGDKGDAPDEDEVEEKPP